MRTPKNAHLWLPGYLRSAVRSRKTTEGPIDILFCIADHFEPDIRGGDRAAQNRRVQRWCREYPVLADAFRDADGVSPRHTFFFPAEIYDPDLVEPLAGLTRAGVAEVEVHLHHDNDSDENLRHTLRTFTSTLAERHGLLACDESSRLVFGFIHGNWALDNSLPGGRFCGVNNELSVLIEAGCYADFTMPSAPSESQARVVNAIYFAADDPLRPGSHRSGTLAQTGLTPGPDRLLMIAGPLQLNWQQRRYTVLPRIDNGIIDFRNVPTRERVRRWLSAGVGVIGQPSWRFVKVYTHGAPEENADVLLGPSMRRFHELLTTEFNDGRQYRLHYVSAREMANIAWAAIDGRTGNPAAYRDYRYRLITATIASPVRGRL